MINKIICNHVRVNVLVVLIECPGAVVSFLLFNRSLKKTVARCPRYPNGSFCELAEQVFL